MTKILKTSSKLITGFLVAILLITPVTAQEGHPLKGSWIGEWESNELHGEFVLLVIDWDGQNISGTINPGTDNMVIVNAELDPTDWSVTINADGYEINGKIKNLGLPSRSIVGTWKRERQSGNFAISRQ